MLETSKRSQTKLITSLTVAFVITVKIYSSVLHKHLLKIEILHPMADQEESLVGASWKFFEIMPKNGLTTEIIET